MSNRNCTRTPSQRGYSLAEIIVATAVFTVVILAALMVYDRSNKVFKQSVEASDMQQSTRVAFDRLVADLRMTGFDYDRDGTPFGALAQTWTTATTYTKGMLVQPTNPNGHTYVCIVGGVSGATEPTWPTDTNGVVTDGGTLSWQEDGTLQYQQPDEQIEYAGKNAVAIRANFNYETATGPCSGITPCENGREPELQSTPFPIVTTANNEIVIYALKPVKWASGESADDLVFYADVASKPRDVNPFTDQKEDAVTITGVDLCNAGCNSPPYTLYRYSLNENGTPDAGVPVADNIRSMSFKYYDVSDAKPDDEITTYPNGDGQYDGAKPELTVAGRDSRNSIRAIELRLVGMNSQPDPKYTDSTDTYAPHYRKMELTSLIVPRNMGRRGMREYNTELPHAPVLETVCAGACNAVYVTWKAPEAGGDIDSYAVLYDTDPCTAGGLSPAEGFQHSEEVGLNLEGSIGRNTIPNTDYYFAVQAINKFGATVSNCFGPVKVINKTKPAALTDLLPSNPAGAGKYAQQANQVDLYFPPATANAGGQDMLSCPGGGVLQQTTMPPSENRYYEIWRSTNPAFDPAVAGAGVRVLDAGSAIQPVVITGEMKWSDVTAANCIDYYYRIRVVDFCARNAAFNDPAAVTQGQSDWLPAVGTNARHGRASSGIAPKAPVLTLASKSCAGASNNCTLNFVWNAVTKNASDQTIAISNYRLFGYLWNAGLNAYDVAPAINQPIANGVLTYSQFVNGSTDKYKFQVRAEDCTDGALSNAIEFPCDFSGVLDAVIVAAGSYGGSGTLADPYIVEGASIRATATTAVSEMSVALFYVDTGAQEGATVTRTGTLTDETFALQQTQDGEKVKVLIGAVDANGCTASKEVYIIDQPAPACSLDTLGDNSGLVSVPKPGSLVTVGVKNEDLTNALKVEQISVGFTVTNQMKGLVSVSFDGSSVTVNCAPSNGDKTVNVTPTTPMNVPANTTKNIVFNMNQGNLNGTNPITSLCISYRASTGDLVNCQIIGGSGTCAIPGTSCQ